MNDNNNPQPTLKTPDFGYFMAVAGTINLDCTLCRFDEEFLIWLEKMVGVTPVNISKVELKARDRNITVDVVWEFPGRPEIFVRLSWYFGNSAVIWQDDEGGVCGRVCKREEFEFYLSPALVYAIEADALEDAYGPDDQDAIDMYWLAVDRDHPDIMRMASLPGHLVHLFSRFQSLDLRLPK